MDEEEEQEQQPGPPPEPPKGIKFFVSNMNTHVGQSLIEELRNDHEVSDPISVHTFVGTIKEDENADVPAGVSKVVK